MDHMTFWLQEQSRKVEASCFGAESRIRGARDIQQVISAMDISVPAELRGVKNSIRGLRELPFVAETRISEMLDSTFSSILEKPEDEKEVLSRRLRRELDLLRGRFPKQAERVRRALETNFESELKKSNRYKF